jgi:hypothetical protein
MLVRIHDVAVAGSITEVTDLYNTELANLDENFLTSNAVHDPGYSNEVGKQNPFYATYEDTEGNVTNTHDFRTPTEYYANFMEARTTEDGINTSVIDPRAAAIWDQVGGQVVGVQQGADNTTAPADLSELRFSATQGLLRGSDQTSFVMTAAEAYFLQSEAAFNGMIAGDAQTFFENGIIESFLALGLSSAQAASYLGASAGVNRIGWAGSTNKIEAIMTQKWIALAGINGAESWIEYTRTGFPDVPLSIIAEQPAKPNRLLYPSSEYSSNSANVPSQSASDAFTTKIFWDIN